MKKRLTIIFIILFFLITAGIVYLNQVILPTKVKSLIIDTLEKQTQKKVSLKEIKFNIFKGLVVRDLSIYDADKAIINIKEGSCVFLVLPIFKKMIIIPEVWLKSPEIFLERKSDNTFNLQDLFSRKAAQDTKGKFAIYVYKVGIKKAIVHFQDSTFPEPFKKDIKNLDLNLYLSLPASIKFNLKSEIATDPAVNISASGVFKIPRQQLEAKISINSFSPKDFSCYYQDFKVNIPQGLIDAQMKLAFKESTLNLELEAKNKDMAITKDNILTKLNSDLTANLAYSFQDKRANYSGKAMVYDSGLSGLEFVDKISDINGEVRFDNSGIFSDKLNAKAYGIPIQAKAALANFNQPVLNVNISSSLLDLSGIQAILKDRFKFVFPGDIKGGGDLSVVIHKDFSLAAPLEVSGYLDIIEAVLRLEKITPLFENISGRLEFTRDQIRWPQINFKYDGLDYKTTGTLTSFQAPIVQFGLSSKDLSLQSAFTVSNKLFAISEFSGRYLNSGFSLAGNINSANPPRLEADIKGIIDLNLEDIKEPLKKFRDKLEKIKPQGKAHAEFSISGNIKDIKSCAVAAKILSPAISLYGLQSGESSLEYSQIDGIAAIPLAHLSLYDGSADFSARMNLNSANLPYWLALDMQGVKIEELKLDTAVKDKDIAGMIKAQAKINGFWTDPSKMNGAGRIFISGGKLWQLNLFKGLGVVLFAKDFANIIFEEGSCSFSIQDQSIFSDDIKLKSTVANLSGAVRIGFDSSIDGSLNVEILSEAIPLTGTFKDVTTAILGEAQKFAVIKISGTLQDTKYKFKAAVTDIIRGLKKFITGN